jgi:Ca-activated chloride channel homolog
MNELGARLAQALSFPVGPSTLELAAPWALLLLGLPFLAYSFLPPYKEQQTAVRVPFFERLATSLGKKPERGADVIARGLLQWLVAPVVFVLLVAAAARPELVEPPIQRTQSARDLLLAVDISSSMDTPDFADSSGQRLPRLEAVKRVLDDFISRRPGDRIGLLLFGDAAYLQAPFTLDHELGRELLAEARVGMAGPRTMIGDAIGSGIKIFEASAAQDKVLVLLTDGNDTGSKVPPRKAADIAKSYGIRIHTVAIGDPATKGPDPVATAALEDIAHATGGASFLALSREELEGIYRKLDEIEKIDLKTATYRPRRALYYWPLGAGAALIVAFYVATGARVLIREARA